MSASPGGLFFDSSLQCSRNQTRTNAPIFQLVLHLISIDLSKCTVYTNGLKEGDFETSLSCEFRVAKCKCVHFRVKFHLFGAIFLFSIYQISEQEFSRVLIGSRNSGFSLAIHCFAPGAKMASCFETFQEDKICAINEEVVSDKFQESDERWILGVHWQVGKLFSG